ncbi:Uncharacterised protein [Mycobacteroides abscessus]|nr:Uncharacterised protein [Mycobacteroides abscessus]
MSAELSCGTEIVTTTSSGSVVSVAPEGSFTSPAVTVVPASRPSMETSTDSGRCVASASMARVCRSTRWMVPGADSPVTATGTSTATFSPFFTMSRSTCSMTLRTGSRWTSLAMASWPLPSSSMEKSAFECLSAIIVWWPGRVTCTGALPWP